MLMLCQSKSQLSKCDSILNQELVLHKSYKTFSFQRKYAQSLLKFSLATHFQFVVFIAHYNSCSIINVKKYLNISKYRTYIQFYIQKVPLNMLLQ